MEILPTVRYDPCAGNEQLSVEKENARRLRWYEGRETFSESKAMNF